MRAIASQARRGCQGRNLVRLLVAAVLGTLAPGVPAAEDEDDLRPPTYQIDPEQLDSWIFGGARSAVMARRDAEGMLRIRINSFRRVASLSNEQQQKLELAGRGDISAFLEECEQLKRGLPRGKGYTRGELLQLQQDCSKAGARASVLFGRGSLFEKTLASYADTDGLRYSETVSTIRRRWGNSATANDEAVAAILEKWREQAAHIRTIEARFDLVRYDSLGDIETRSQGRWIFESPGRTRLDLSPKPIGPGEISARRDDRGNAMTLKAGRSEIWILTGGDVLRLRENDQIYEQFHAPPAVAEPFRDSDEGEVQHIDGLFSLPVPHSIASPDLIRRFFWKILEEDVATVRLLGTPRFDHEARRITSITVVLRRETWGTQLIKVVDRRGTRESIYSFRETRVNQPWTAEAANAPFHPDLSGYRELASQPGP